MSDNQNQTANQPSTEKKVKARVLSAVTIGEDRFQPNDVISVDTKTLKAHADQLDADPAAVRYAEQQKRKASSDSVED
jgi:hypothetical protein